MFLTLQFTKSGDHDYYHFYALKKKAYTVCQH